jgi:hypothetical protein
MSSRPHLGSRNSRVESPFHNLSPAVHYLLDAATVRRGPERERRVSSIRSVPAAPAPAYQKRARGWAKSIRQFAASKGRREIGQNRSIVGPPPFRNERRSGSSPAPLGRFRREPSGLAKSQIVAVANHGRTNAGSSIVTCMSPSTSASTRTMSAPASHPSSTVLGST